MTTDEEFQGLEDLMQDVPVSDNHGRGAVHGNVAWEDDYDMLGQVKRHPLAASAIVEFLKESSWSLKDATHGRSASKTHRGVLHPDEWVAAEELLPMLEECLGFTLLEFDELYRDRTGRPPKRLAENRVRIDECIRKIVEGDGNMELLAKILGVKDSRLYEAAIRARRRDQEPPAECTSRLIDGSKSCTSSIAAARRATVPCSYRHVRLPGKTFDSREAMLAALEQL